jgi:hypothetical protein
MTITLAAIFFLSTILVTQTQLTQAQLEPQQPVSGELPSGVTPNITVSFKAFLSFRPNPVGVGQTVLVNMWMTPSVNAQRFHQNYKITITDPDGNKEEVPLDSYCADSTGWFEFAPDQVGTWKLKFEFPGEYYPAGQYYNGYIVTNSSGSYLGSAYYKPASTAEQTLVVQDEQVYSWPSSPLPTDYWTRPVSPENREWTSILGDYPWTGPAMSANWAANTNVYSNNYAYIPYVQAPNTAHIVWMKQGAISGMIGGDNGQSSYTSGGGNPNIIYQGRAYQSVTKPFNGVPQAVWQCYDLRTGTVYWEVVAATAPTAIEYSSGAAAVPGAEFSVGTSATLISISGGRLIKYNPWTGAISLNVSTSPLTSANYFMNGYCLSLQTINATTGNYRLINWTTLGTSTNFTSRIVSNITWPVPALPTAQYVGSTGICVADFETGMAAWITRAMEPNLGIMYKVNVTGISLTTGAIMWNVAINDEATYSGSCVVADHGKAAFLTQNGYWLAYDLNSGSLAWKGEQMDYPWSSGGFGAYAVQSAYGLLYRQAYDGVYAFDWDTGDIAWHYIAYTPFEYETPYTDKNGTGTYSFNGGGFVADGKLYTYNTEHSASQPITRGWRLHCINATTGEGIWNITGSMTPGAVADGYMTASNAYDGYMYVFGKGQSVTTVSAPQTQIVAGTNVIISGTVLDLSSGQEGTPCVSAQSMTQWMEYLHMQHSIPADVVGVPVSIDAVDPNGNSVHIATVTSDGYSGTFSYTWTPDLTGDYQITATFIGDDSYGSSFATTYANVVDASAASPTSSAISFDAVNNTIMTAMVASVVAMVVAIAIAVLILRRR